ncbi:MAG: peptidase M14 [Gemmatimonadetes bacterium]|nr:peptidase M14 [Gemmatimonadota bacterium]
MKARPRPIRSALVLGAILWSASAAHPWVAGARPQQGLRATGAETPPHPASVFGFEPGADHKLADYSAILEYFRALDAASARVREEEIGRSVLGRPLILAVISSEENLRQIERWRSISERLARAVGLSDEEARRLAGEGRAVVWIDGGLHATEVAGAQHTPLLAYTVATDTSQAMQRVRENVVLLLMPVMNPDGLDIVAEWYRRNLGTPYETADLPWLYHHYVGHDNNRDWYMITQPETEAVARILYHEWYPQIVYNHHQTGPFPARIFVPPFAEPVSPHIPPLVIRGVNLVGSAMANRFAREGKPGVVSRVVYNAWWNGGMRTAPYFHNMIGILTETALYEYATPRYYTPDSLPPTFRSAPTLSTVQPSTFYPDPWKGGWWRLRDAVDYMMTGSHALLEIAAARKDDWLYGIYQMGREAIEKGRAGNPFAYVIAPGEQWDAGEAVQLVNVLRRGGVEVHRATEPFQAGGREYPSGSYVVYAAQAFRPHVLDLLERQVYPDRRLYPGGPREPPYDIAGWTLPIQMGVAMRRVEEPFVARSEAVDVARVEPGQVVGHAGYGYLLSHRPNTSVLAVNRLLKDGERVGLAAAGFEAAGERFDAGTIVIRNGGRRTRQRIEALARDQGLEFVALARPPGVRVDDLRLPRVGLYGSWVANMDEGWTRWILDRYEFPFDRLRDTDLRRGNLHRYDAIILASQDPFRILGGHTPGTMPPEYVGGLGPEGAAALKRYVQAGGSLVALDSAADFAIAQFGLPVENSAARVPRDSFYIPGSLVALRLNTAHALAYGMPDSAAAFFVESRAFKLVKPAGGETGRAQGPQVEVVARYGDGDPLLSGWAVGAERYLAGNPAVVRVPLGKGSVVLIGFRAQFRGQPRATFKLLFNALHAATVNRAPTNR